jgi:acetoacetyl-CoA synthetase
MARRPDAFTASLPPALQRVRQTMGQAMETYQPRPYHAGPVVYVRATVPQKGRGDPLPLWRRVARGGLVIAEVSGGHHEILVEPNLRVVAELLDEGLGSV